MFTDLSREFMYRSFYTRIRPELTLEGFDCRVHFGVSYTKYKRLNFVKCSLKKNLIFRIQIVSSYLFGQGNQNLKY